MTQELGFLHQDSFLHVVDCLVGLTLPSKINSIDKFLINLRLPGKFVEPNLWEIDEFTGACLNKDSGSKNGESDPNTSVTVTHAFVSTSHAPATPPPLPFW